jgi:hypothetical protein
MIIACILCGGVLEVTLVMMGLSALINWLKNRHKKERCPCCKNIKNRPMTADEKASINKFFLEQIDKKEKNE